RRQGARSGTARPVAQPEGAAHRAGGLTQPSGAPTGAPAGATSVATAQQEPPSTWIKAENGGSRTKHFKRLIRVYPRFSALIRVKKRFRRTVATDVAPTIAPAGVAVCAMRGSGCWRAS